MESYDPCLPATDIPRQCALRAQGWRLCLKSTPSSGRPPGGWWKKASRYGAIKPIPNSLIASGEDVVGALAQQDRLAVNVWLVLLHNTRLGSTHPESTVANAFGDRYIYSLCPSAPDARAYAIGLANHAQVTLRQPRSTGGKQHDSLGPHRAAAGASRLQL